MKDNNDVVFIDLDKPRELKLTHSVLKRFAAKKGVSVDDIDTVLAGYTGMVDLIYEMLLREDPDRIDPGRINPDADGAREFD